MTPSINLFFALVFALMLILSTIEDVQKDVKCTNGENFTYIIATALFTALFYYTMH